MCESALAVYWVQYGGVGVDLVCRFYCDFAMALVRQETLAQKKEGVALLRPLLCHPSSVRALNFLVSSLLTVTSLRPATISIWSAY